MIEGNLKLFVWEGEDVLTNYPGGASGLICILAHDLTEALKLLKAKDFLIMGYFPIDDYEVVEEPAAFFVWGSE